jgi:hypothetical protein
MRTFFTTLLIVVLLLVGQVWAQAPLTVVAQTSWPNPYRITLLNEPCGWPGGAMRAQWIQQNHRIEWGCWGYNETGVQVQWSTDQQVYIDFLELFYFDDRGWFQQMGYNRMHRRVLRLHNTPG